MLVTASLNHEHGLLILAQRHLTKLIFKYNMHSYMFQLFLFSGTYNIIINPGKSRSTQINFRLKSKASSRPTPGILCEKGNYMFTSTCLRSFRLKTSIILSDYVIIMQTLSFLDDIYKSFLGVHWYPCFGLLVMSFLGLKARHGSLIHTWHTQGIHVTCSLKFTSGQHMLPSYCSLSHMCK